MLNRVIIYARHVEPCSPEVSASLQGQVPSASARPKKTLVGRERERERERGGR